MSAPRFRLLGELGRGGMAVVHLAVDRSTGEKVALKLLHAHLSEQRSARRRLERELEASQSVQHPAVVAVQERVEVDGCLGLVLPLCTGGTLQERVDTEGPLDPAQLAELLDVIGGALKAAHGVGVLHRDLTPGNVLLDPAAPGHGYRLADFGLARLADGHTASTTVMGTPGYAPPDAFGAGRADPRLDGGSLGAVLYFAAVGRPPFGEDAPSAVLQRQLTGTPETPLAEARPDLDPRFIAVVNGLLSPVAGDRPDLDTALGWRTDQVVQQAVPHTPARQRAWAATGAAVSLLLLVAIGLFQDFGSFLISTIVDGHAIPRADVFEMTQGVSALLFMPLALLPAVAGALAGAGQPVERRIRPWAGILVLAALDLLYAFAAGVVLPQLGMRSGADIFGTMLFHQMAFIPATMVVLAIVRPWVGLWTDPRHPKPPPESDPLVAHARLAAERTRQALANAPEAVRLDLQDAVQQIALEVDRLGHLRRELDRRRRADRARPVELGRLEARLVRARALQSPQVDDLERALAAAEQLQAQADELEHREVRTAARLMELRAVLQRCERQVSGRGEGGPEGLLQVTQALERLRVGGMAMEQVREELR